MLEVVSSPKEGSQQSLPHLGMAPLHKSKQQVKMFHLSSGKAPTQLSGSWAGGISVWRLFHQPVPTLGDQTALTVTDAGPGWKFGQTVKPHCPSSYRAIFSLPPRPPFSMLSTLPGEYWQCKLGLTWQPKCVTSYSLTSTTYVSDSSWLEPLPILTLAPDPWNCMPSFQTLIQLIHCNHSFAMIYRR